MAGPIGWRQPIAALALLFASSAMALPSFDEVKRNYAESDAWLLARDGRPLHSRRIDMKQRRLPWTKIEEVSPPMLRALLVSEDRNFYQHGGVDWNAVAASAWRNLWNGKTRGASTLSMQLAGLLDEEAQRKGRRSLLEKAGQTAGALWLEQHWKKDQILEAYLNLAGFRGELIGVAAMSRGLFGKWPDGLDEREAALAAALLRAPAANADSVAQRACGVLRGMAELGKRSPPDCDSLDALAKLALSGGLKEGSFIPAQSPNLAPHLAQKLLKNPGERLKTTLDADLQAFASRALQRQLRELARQNAEDGAVIVIDNVSGDILAWVGSSGALSDAPAVDGVVALRQAGSTLKPFLYGLALERRYLTAASLLDDSPLSITTSNGLYVPQNYSSQYRGWVSARMALGGSLNIPAVRTLTRLGLDAFHQRLREFGFASLTESGDYYGYSLALGSADVSLLMLANAYRTLANQGHWTPLRAVPDGKRQPCADAGCTGIFSGARHNAADAGASFIISDILADRSARAGTFGLENWLATPYWSAVKTGTSKDMRDNWCIGYTPRHTVAVWVGNASGAAMHDVSGVSGAAPVWREVMDKLINATHRSGMLSPPPQIERKTIHFAPPFEPKRHEWFLHGSELTTIRPTDKNIPARILYPSNGIVIAFDPDIPLERQKIAFHFSLHSQSKVSIDIDGHHLEDSPSQIYYWPIIPGKHRLSITTQGLTLDQAEFFVKAIAKRK